MIVACIALIAIACFMLGFWWMRVVPVAARSLATFRETIARLRDPFADDHARETAARRAAIKLFGGFASILSRSLVAVAAGAAPILVADVLGLAGAASVAAFLARWDVVVVASVLVLGLVYLKVRFWHPG